MQRHRVFGMAAMLAVVGCGPGAPSAAPTSTASTAQTAAVATQAPTVVPSPSEVTAIAGVPARRLELGTDAAPIDIAYGFGSIWVANHHTDDVVRIDPVTMTPVARIPIGNVTTGPGWFAVLPDSIWVSNQNRRGMTPIDPVTNTAGEAIGMGGPCGEPVVALGSIWQSACDAGQIMRIDPVNRTVEDVDNQSHDFLFQAGDRMVVTRRDGSGIDLFDPRARTFTKLADIPGVPIGYDGKTLWISDDASISRIDPGTGKVVATLAIRTPGPGSATFRDGHAWISAGHDGIIEVDLDTNEILRSLVVTEYPSVIRDLAGSLWLTSFQESTLWRVTP